ncbi:hypothetical protein VCR5J5_1330008 [Vibrio crassostreae]|uniref:Uncharacterized protein n=1 Tax=Vibrio crassostreae TaxID=246167 RepID=A0A822MND7_9VIBR|nr:hypothetical protein VCR5J5_1330008 [Vibrio crassostreae]CDT49192.1 hypothetical protein VCR29J2_350092 [Vibrio coralliirubri]
MHLLLQLGTGRNHSRLLSVDCQIAVVLAVYINVINNMEYIFILPDYCKNCLST